MPLPIPGPNQDVLPRSDADFKIFADNFSTNWNPADAGVTVPLAATIVTSAGAFTTALLLAVDPLTRTPVTVAAKDSQRVLTSDLLRDASRSAHSAYRNGVATMDSAALTLLGLRTPKLTRTPIAEPTFAPAMAVAGLAVGITILRVTQIDQITGLPTTNRRFAYGITGIELQRKVGAGAFTSVVTTKRVIIRMGTGGVTPGDDLAFRSRYVTATGGVSPWSSESTTVAT